MEGGDGRISIAILIGVWATFALDVFSTLNSSPQTTQINAAKRADSLMHWVAIGWVVAVGGGVTASVVSRKIWPAVATTSVATGLWLLYVYAKRKGLAEDAAGTNGTESYA